MRTIIDGPKADAPDADGGLLSELSAAAADAMEMPNTPFASARAGWSNVLAARIRLAAIEGDLEKLNAEHAAYLKRYATRCDALLAERSDAERGIIASVHAERALSLATPPRLGAALGAARRRAAELETIIGQLREAGDGARRNERENRADATHRATHPDDAVHAAPFAVRADAAAARAADYEARRDAAALERGELLRGISEVEKTIRS